MRRHDNKLPGRRVPIWPWLEAIDKLTGRSRLDQHTRKRKVKRADERRWRREEGPWMARKDPEDDEGIPPCNHPQGHEWEPRATLSCFVLWRCKHCPWQSATNRPVADDQ